MRRAAVLGAVLAAAGTAAVGVAALMGVSRMPVAEYLLFPGSMAAWVYKGDTFTSNQQFLAYAILLGVPINAVVGAILGVLLAALRRRTMRDSP